MHAEAPHFVSEVSERPRASLLARLQAQRGAVASTLVHKNVEMEDPIGQKLLQLLDGTRDRRGLADELVAYVLSDTSLKKPDGTTPEVSEVRQIVEGALDANLQKLARMALLEA
jgi:hypothetical protein